LPSSAVIVGQFEVFSGRIQTWPLEFRTRDQQAVRFAQQRATWPESVDQALCLGWIDGVRKRIDDESYSIRFTPRKRASNWSTVNIGRVSELTRLGLMQPAGLEAFAQRSEAKSGIYAYENAPRSLNPQDEKLFRTNSEAWKYFSAQPPSYRRVAIYWVISAKKEETRARRLATLISDSAQGRRIGVAQL